MSDAPTDAPLGFDWPALMRVAYQGLGLSPEAFWRMTPGEFLILLGPESGGGPLRRDAFDALLARFPDSTNAAPTGEAQNAAPTADTQNAAPTADTRNEDGHDRDG